MSAKKVGQYELLPVRLVAVALHGSCAECGEHDRAVFQLPRDGSKVVPFTLCAVCVAVKLPNVELFVPPTAIEEVLRWHEK